jgi:fatty acid omega-hydroxylase
MCMNFVLAGRDTTFAALSWFFWLLIQHPDVEEKVLLEIQRILD